MQKFKFGNPASVVEVSKSPLDRPEPGTGTRFSTAIVDYLAEQKGRAKHIR